MKNSRILAVMLPALALMAACGDAVSDNDPVPTPQPELRELTIPPLPSPYYHFDYDAGGRVARVAFASGATSYELTYAGERIATMQQVGGDRLTYVYNAAGRVSEISVTDSHAAEYLQIQLTYDGSRLTRVRWDRQVQDAFVVDRVIDLTYYADGNLQERHEQRNAIAGRQDASDETIRFETYDDGINVDSFSLLHTDFGDPIFLLPGVRLQRGNPARVTSTRSSGNYSTDYSYVYDSEHRPTAKLGHLTYETGPSAGQSFDVQSFFVYY